MSDYPRRKVIHLNGRRGGKTASRFSNEETMPENFRRRLFYLLLKKRKGEQLDHDAALFVDNMKAQYPARYLAINSDVIFAHNRQAGSGS